MNRLLKLWTIGRVFEPIKALSDNASAFDTIVSLDVGTQLIQVDLWGIVIRVASDVGRQEIFVEFYIEPDVVMLLLSLGISENSIHTEASRMTGCTKKKYTGNRVVFHGTFVASFSEIGYAVEENYILPGERGGEGLL